MFTKEYYNTDLVPKLKEVLGITNINALPKIEKISVNVGAGSLSQNNKKIVEEIAANLAQITGQKPVITKAKKAISNFKIREDYPVGVTVTLRGERMYEFLNRLINITFPRIRDFRGFSARSFDGNGNLAIGINDHTVFPEITPDDVIATHGIQINIQTSAKNNKEGYELLKLYGFPFKEKTFN